MRSFREAIPDLQYLGRQHFPQQCSSVADSASTVHVRVHAIRFAGQEKPCLHVRPLDVARVANGYTSHPYRRNGLKRVIGASWS